MSSNPNTEIVKAGSQAIQVLNSDLAVMRTALNTNIGAGGLTEFDLPRIKIPAGGATQWVVPTLEGESSEPVIEGVIILARDTRAYYSKPLAETGGGQPPDCFSNDSVEGTGQPGGNCFTCPLAQFGSAKDAAGKPARGQACKQLKQLFVVRGGLLLPEVIALPPTSLKSAKQYLLKLAAQGIPYHHVVTRIGLEKSKNSQGIPYSKATLAFVSRLSAEHIAKASEYRQLIAPLVKNMVVEADATVVNAVE